MKCHFEPLSEYVYAVVFDDAEDNIYEIIQERWHDAAFLRNFFHDPKNKEDLAIFWGQPIDNKLIRVAINDSIDDADYIDSIIDTENIDDLIQFFHLLDNRESELTGPPLKKEKGHGEHKHNHNSWMRLYAIRISDDADDLQSSKIYIITGGAIKLTQEMKDRDHTKAELEIINNVCNFLQSKGVTDIDGFDDYMNEYYEKE